MKKIFVLATVLFVQSTYALLGGIFSPITDLFSSSDGNRIEFYEHIESVNLSKCPEYFMYFETDFENTGEPYIWVSHDKNDVGSGYFFNIYKKVDDHYELLPDNPVFTPELLAFYGKNYSDEKPRLLTYSKISGQTGNIVYYNMVDDKPVAKVWRTIEPLGEDSEMFEKLFPENNSFVKKIHAAEMIDFLVKRGIKAPTKDKIAFLAFDLGGRTGVVLLATNPSVTKGASGWLAFNMVDRENTILNDIGLGAVGIDFSLDSLIPFEVRNPNWKRIKVFPEGRKIIFFKNYSFVRKIDNRKFLITINKDGVDKTSLTFYQMSSNRICAFDIADLRVKESSNSIDADADADGFAFLKALDFDYDKDSKYFNYQLYPSKDVVYKGNDITIPSDLDVDDDIFELKEIVLPEKNRYTDEFRKKWKEVRDGARVKQKREEAKARKNVK